MTKDELADRLNHLDPGAILTVSETDLAILFGDGRLTKEAIAVVEAFALDHRCTFLIEPSTRAPMFEKDDIFDGARGPRRLYGA